MKIKHWLWLLLAVSIIAANLYSVFRKEYHALVIKDIDPLVFNDSIVYVSYYKDDNGSGIETRLKNCDTPFCFSGFNEKLHASYSGYGKKGDVLIKEKNADSFYIKRNDTLIVFLLSRCDTTVRKPLYY